MAWLSLPTKPFLCICSLSIFLILLLPQGSWAKQADPGAHPILTYHNGPILTGQLNLGILWYGRFGRAQKMILRDFIRSLNNKKASTITDPRVSTWWKTVGQYQAAVRGRPGRNPAIKVRIVRQKTDRVYSVGKVLTHDFFPDLVAKATGGVRSSIALIFTARDVTVDGTCMGRCSLHGTVGDGASSTVYMVVGNPETECPGSCAWPFHKADSGPQTFALQPPNGNVGADAMVIGLASVLAETVTNPYNTGFYKGFDMHPIEAVSACPGIFGSGAFPGYPGKVHIDPSTGGCFNAHGVNGRKFLLPAVWNPITRACWTLM